MHYTLTTIIYIKKAPLLTIFYIYSLINFLFKIYITLDTSISFCILYTYRKYKKKLKQQE